MTDDDAYTISSTGVFGSGELKKFHHMSLVTKAVITKYPYIKHTNINFDLYFSFCKIYIYIYAKKDSRRTI